MGRDRYRSSRNSDAAERQLSGKPGSAGAQPTGIGALRGTRGIRRRRIVIASSDNDERRGQGRSGAGPSSFFWLNVIQNASMRRLIPNYYIDRGKLISTNAVCLPEVAGRRDFVQSRSGSARNDCPARIDVTPVLIRPAAATPRPSGCSGTGAPRPGFRGSVPPRRVSQGNTHRAAISHRPPGFLMIQ
jgi:hypothetical protein